MTERVPPTTTYTEEWLARIDHKLGLLIDAVKPSVIEIAEPSASVDDLITEPKPARQRQRTRQGNQIQ